MTIVRIGVAVPDVGDFVEHDSAYGIGDQREQFFAACDVVRERDLLPDDVELQAKFGSFSVVDTAGKRAVADHLAARGAVAVVGGRDFTYGAVRLAERHHIPVLDVNAVPTSLLARTAPWMFTLRSAQDVLYRGFVRWAHREGHLAGARIGVFADRFTKESTQTAVSELEALGHRVAVQVNSDGAGFGSDHDVSAAEQFGHAGVNLVLPFVSGSSMIELLRAMEERGHFPTVLDLETGEHTTDVTAHLTPRAIYDSTVALTMNRVGGLAPSATEVLDAYERRTGRRLDATDWRHSGELTNLLIVHDLVLLLAKGIRGAPRPVTPASVVEGLESIGPSTLLSGGTGWFTPDEHWAFRQVRPIRWSAHDDHWHVLGEYEDLALLCS